MAAAFLYGIGAAKAGTTWLAHALRAHPQVALPPAKESHYFDSVEYGSSMRAVDQMLRVREKKRAAMQAAPSDQRRNKARAWVEELDRWIALIAAQEVNDEKYEALMQRRAREGVKVVADITPAYALCSDSTFSRMAALNGGQTKFLMILRDPVDRLWSNIGMTLAHRDRRGRASSAARSDIVQTVLARGGDAPEFARSDYAGTLTRLYAAVPEPRRLVLFFEELFTPETLGQLTEFLGLDTQLSGPDEKVHAGATATIPAEDRALLAERLRPQYDDIQTRMGRLPDRWQETVQTTMVTS